MISTGLYWKVLEVLGKVFIEHFSENILVPNQCFSSIIYIVFIHFENELLFLYFKVLF